MDTQAKAEVLAKYRRKQAGREVRRECAELMYSYPGIPTVEDALEMPQGDRRLLLTYAAKRRQEDMLTLANVIASAQSEKGFKKLTNSLKEAIKQLEQQL